MANKHVQILLTLLDSRKMQIEIKYDINIYPLE